MEITRTIMMFCSALLLILVIANRLEICRPAALKSPESFLGDLSNALVLSAVCLTTFIMSSKDFIFTFSLPTRTQQVGFSNWLLGAFLALCLK